MDKLNHFIAFCKKLQPQNREDIERFFEGVVFFPYDNELLLQAFLFLNTSSYFPFCTDLLLFEKSPNGENTDQGKCDFVYLTRDHRIALIETKFIDTENTGPTERRRRTEHRKKVFEQVTNLRQGFSDTWSIPTKLIDCYVFTTEDLRHRDEATTIEAKYIPIRGLKKWQEEMKSVLQSEVSIPSKVVFDENGGLGLGEIDKVWMNYYICDICSHPEICTASKMCYFDLAGGY